MDTVIATGSHGCALLGANRYTSAWASYPLAKTQVAQTAPAPAATAVAVRRPKPALRAPRHSMMQMVAVVPINPTSTIAHTYIGSVLMDLSVAVVV
jgi:hypothetical protein